MVFNLFENVYFYLSVFLTFILVYVYVAYAWHTIAKKHKYRKYWIAWIPLVQFFLLPILAKKKWYYGFVFILPFIFLILPNFKGYGLILFLLRIVCIYFIVSWSWYIFEKQNYPGFLSLVVILFIIPVLNIFAFIAYLIILGFIAFKTKIK
jgi:hypothetical protein